MSTQGHHGLLLAGGSQFVALMTALVPSSWLRLGDNAANNAVADSSIAPSNGLLYEVLTTTAQNAVNTSTRAHAGLLNNDTDGCFNFAGASLITVPKIALTNATGWTAFFVMYPSVAPISANNGIGTIFQFTNNGAGSGCPELDVLNKSDGTFRFRVMQSGVGEIAMSAAPSWAWATKLAVAFKKEANGNLKIFVNGALVATTTGNPGFTYGTDVMRWGAAKFASVPWYQFPGLMDELAIFNAPLSDANCQQLTALAAA